MRKRLRKKKHIAEFTEWGRQLIIHRNRKDGFDDFLDAFIEEAVEANECYCGGVGKGDVFDAVIELGRDCEDPDARMAMIVAWLGGRDDVHSWKMGEAFDIWNGDIEDAIEQ